MKSLKALLLIFAFASVGVFAQDLPYDDLPTATLDENFHLTLDPSVPVAEYYRVDIDHLEFLNEEDAVTKCRIHLTGNLISNEVHYSEQLVIVRIHTEYMPEDVSYVLIQDYLGQLTKPN